MTCQFVNVRTGKVQTCRIEAAMAEDFLDDPITVESGCGGEFMADWARKDRADGCPACIEAFMP